MPALLGTTPCGWRPAIPGRIVQSLELPLDQVRDKGPLLLGCAFAAQECRVVQPDMVRYVVVLSDSIRQPGLIRLGITAGVAPGVRGVVVGLPFPSRQL